MPADSGIVCGPAVTRSCDGLCGSADTHHPDEMNPPPGASIRDSRGRHTMDFRCVAARAGVLRGLMEGVPDPPSEAGDEADLLRSVADGFVDAFNRRDVDDLV